MRRAASLGLAVAGIMAYGTGLHALSCMPYGITDSYIDAANDSAEYNVLKGRLTFNQKQLDRRLKHLGRNQGSNHTQIKAHLSGAALGPSDFTIPADLDVTIQFNCFATWCPTATSGRDVFLFARKVHGGLLVTLDACAGGIHALTPEAEDAVLSCHQGGPCVRREEEWHRAKN